MTLDATTIGAILGFFGLIVTTLGGVYVATRTNRSEKASSALRAFEETRDESYEQRLLLRDERIAILQEDVTKLKDELESCKNDNRLRIEELEAEIDKKNVEIDRLRGNQ